jgi:hypothetical protein
MRIASWSAVVTAGLLGLASAASAQGIQPAPSAQPEGPRAPAEIRVPEGSGVPVITDGLFSPGEWDDAHRLAVTPSVQLYVKQYRGVVFIGVRGEGPAGIGPSGLFLAVPGGPIHELHVSAQLGERVLPATGEGPPFRFGYTSDWYANEQRRDMQEAERLRKEGKDPISIMIATAFPADGIEFAIRRSKLPGPRWLMRLAASALEGGRPGMLVHPAGAPERTTDGWQALRLD